MELAFNSEQGQLADSVRRMLADHYSFAQRRVFLQQDEALHAPAWRQFVELGLTALMVPQADAGLGGDARALLPVLREFGRALVVEPYVSSCVLAATAVQRAGSDAQREALLPGVAAGSLRLAWVGEVETTGPLAAADGMTATLANGRWTLQGTQASVSHVAAAHWLVLPARIAGSGGTGLFLLDAAHPSITRREHRLIDGTRAADVTLHGAPAQALGGPGARETNAGAVVAAVEQLGAAAACAEMLGVVELAWSFTCDYVNTRQQFGRVLAANQAVRHRIADMRVALEVITSAAMLAAVAADDPDSVPDAGADIAGAMLVVARQSRKFCEDAIQLHGGIGMTEEYAVGHCLRRLLVLEQGSANPDTQLQRLADSLLTTGNTAPLP